jgi:hypothetical protein
MEIEQKQIINEGLWRNNTALVQLLGLCPLLAVSGTVVNALGLGIATTLVLAGSNVTVSLIRNVVRPDNRLLCNSSGATNAGVPLRPLSGAGYIYSAHRHELRHHRPCRILCFQK